MSTATAALRIEPLEGAVDALESVITSSRDSGIIASALLDAAQDAIRSSGGAVLLMTSNPEVFEVTATSAPDLFPMGKRLRSIRTPKGGKTLILKACGVEFGKVILLNAGRVEPGKQPLIDRILLASGILYPLTELETVRHRMTETNAIVEVGQVLTGLLAMDDVLSYVVYLAESLVRGNCATIALLSPDRSELVLKNSTGSLRAAEGDSIPVDKSLMGWVVQHGEPVITNNVSDDSRSFELSTRQGPGLVVPVHINGETIGAFLVARLEDGHPFTEENLDTLQKMAAYAAIAIHNAQLYREQTDAAATLREQATELQGAYSELNRQQEQLIVSEKMAALGRITAGIAHEINSPLGGIMNSLRTARGYVEEYRSSIGDPEITPDDHNSIASDILGALSLAENASAKVAQFVRSIKTQTRPGEGQKTPFDPAAEIEATVLLLHHRLTKDNVAVYQDLDKGLVLTGDQGKFAVVVQNLISNAIDAYEDGHAQIWIKLKAVDAGVCLEVTDKGSGIPEEIKNRIFDYLFTTKDVGKGTGLGLAMVHSVVISDFGGEIELDSEVGRGTTFRLILPLTRTHE